MKVSEYYFERNYPFMVLSGHKTYRWSLKMRVDHIPREEMVFKIYGPFLYSEMDNFVRIYHHKRGTKDGFAGRTIALNVEGVTVDFPGSLWDPTIYTKQKPHGVPEYRACSITTEKKVMEIGHTFYAGYVTKDFYYDLWNNAMDVLYCENCGHNFVTDCDCPVSGFTVTHKEGCVNYE